jgi:hypothetical protein
MAAVQGLGLACGGESSSRRVSVTDSAGVSIISSLAPAWPAGQPLWRLASEPELEIGVAAGDSDYELSGVAGATRMSDGRIIIANARSAELRVFDRTGVHEGRIGRNGVGPGEFRNLGAVWRLGGDSIVTYDRALRRITFCDPQGNLARMLALASPGNGLSPSATGVFDDGSLLVLASAAITPAAGPGVHRIAGTVFHYGADGRILGTIASLATEEWVILEFENGPVLTLRAFARNGWAVTDGRLVFLADNDRYDVRVYRPDGTLIRRLRRGQANPRVTGELIERYTNTRLGSLPDEEARRVERRLIEAMPFPETVPAFSGILTVADGTLWIQATVIAGDTSLSFSVFDPTGVWLGDVAVPARFRVFEVGTDYVLGRAIDEVGVERVRLYRLLKS